MISFVCRVMLKVVCKSIAAGELLFAFLGDEKSVSGDLLSALE